LLPAELGLAGTRMLAVPSHVKTCNDAENCCWRWLAHSLLKEVEWGAQELQTAQSGLSAKMKEREQIEHDFVAFAELRGAHFETQKQLDECKMQAKNLTDELAVLRSESAQKAARALELERQTMMLLESQRALADKESEAQHRAAELEVKLVRAGCREEELRRRLQDSEEGRRRAVDEAIRTHKLERQMSQIASQLQKNTRAAKPLRRGAEKKKPT